MALNFEVDAVESGSVYLVPGQGVSPYGSLSSDFIMDRRELFGSVLEQIDEVAIKCGYTRVGALVLGEEQLQQPAYGAEQLAHFASSVVLLTLLERHGLRPKAIVAQSFGEIAALVASGVYSIEAGAYAACFMNDAYASQPCEGGLVIVATGEDGAHELIARSGNSGLSIAGTNTARQTVLAGDEGAIASLLALVGQPEVPVIVRLPVPYLTHHPSLTGIANHFESALRSLPTEPLSVPVYSVVGRRWYAPEEDFSRALADCVIRPMYLREGLEQFENHRPAQLIELGAGDMVTRATRVVLRGAKTIAPLARDISWLEELMVSSSISPTQSMQS